MIAEQYGTELYYIEGDKNVVADFLSRLGLEEPLKSEPNLDVKESTHKIKLAESFSFTRGQAQVSAEPSTTAFHTSFKIL